MTAEHARKILARELDSRGWEAATLARTTGLALATTEALLVGQVAIDPFTARRLGCALGTSQEFWLNLVNQE